ncbi:zinc finger CCCH domain-containing protein 37 isoform X1 [Macadamia integrifolia]|uniref:zinc finger CCCH domain-containing protein 37 isoform X1 n=1 Tax=Macadamia integrifolia TaxID=60698 RepID=UPI001C4F63F9|nr:zinc finger CCCH domain-containing protein 37 isoform X1 [Macadamia integrifolia]
MANQLYGYNPTYGGTGIYPSRLTSGSVTDPYLSDMSLIGSSRYLSSETLSATDSSKYSVLNRESSMFLNQNDGSRFSDTDVGGVGSTGFSTGRISGGIGAAMGATMPSYSSQMSWPGVDYGASVAGMKRPSEALYHQTVLGNHNTIGQSEALFSTNSFVKRPRYESASNFPIYPQRPGEKDCAHYMLTGTCKFGDTCKFDHPLWVPEGGIPDWKEVPLIATSESLPERPGEPDCPYFLKTQKCKFGFRCKFNHPKDQIASSVPSENVDASILPERPSEPLCAFYTKTGKCKFGATCKFHHPKDIKIPSAGLENGYGQTETELVVNDGGTTPGDAKPVKPFVPFTPALLHNSKGLPIRPGEVDCPFYLKTGSCKYGVTCRYNHPDRNVINPPVAAALGHAMITSPAANLNMGVISPAASLLPNVDPRLAQTALGMGPTIYPQRPGQIECDFYMKTGECKFGERCKFHHPIDRSAPTPSMAKQVLQQNVKLTLAGLPRREGAIICPFYMKTGTCKYSVTCRFDHPPPGEAIAMATERGTSASAGGGGEEKEDQTVQEQQ